MIYVLFALYVIPIMREMSSFHEWEEYLRDMITLYSEPQDEQEKKVYESDLYFKILCFVMTFGWPLVYFVEAMHNMTSDEDQW